MQNAIKLTFKSSIIFLFSLLLTQATLAAHHKSGHAHKGDMKKDNGLIIVKSNHSVKVTADKLEKILT